MLFMIQKNHPILSIPASYALPLHCFDYELTINYTIITLKLYVYNKSISMINFSLIVSWRLKTTSCPDVKYKAIELFANNMEGNSWTGLVWLGLPEAAPVSWNWIAWSSFSSMTHYCRLPQHQSRRALF